MVFFCLTSSNLGRIIAQPRGDTTQVQLLYQLATDGFGYSSLILLWKMLDRFSGGTTTNSSATGSGATGSGVTNSSMTTARCDGASMSAVSTRALASLPKGTSFGPSRSAYVKASGSDSSAAPAPRRSSPTFLRHWLSTAFSMAHLEETTHG